MWWDKIKRQDERLEQRLRDDALRDRSEFSESLHRRICESIERIRTTSTPATDDPLPRPNRRSGWLTVVLAASLILAVAVLWQAIRTAPMAQVPVDPPIDSRVTQKVPSAIAPTPQSSPAEHTADPLLVRIDRTLASLQWAFLDHDARLTWQLVTQMLPGSVVPESSKD